MEDSEFVKAKIKKHNIGGYQRHIILCIGPSCCESDKGQEVWDHLKSALKDKDPDKFIYRTKANCLRICKSGPVAVVYPDGTWYGHVDKEAINRIIDQHLIGGEPVSELRIAENPLPSNVDDNRAD